MLASKSSEKMTGLSRVFILEDLSPDFVELLGLSLRIDPSFFAKHLRDVPPEKHPHYSNGPFATLQKDADPSHEFSLLYTELVSFNDSSLLRHTGKLYCESNIPKRITTPGGLKDFYDGIGLIKRRTSFWSKDSSAG